jgi:ubiquinone/menaquinone biosynthesis C-methylase UbiE
MIRQMNIFEDDLISTPKLTRMNDDETALRYREKRISHWNDVAFKLETWRGLGGYYQKRLEQIYQNLIPPGRRVLEIGCSSGDLLAALNPVVGVGVDFSSGMIERARQRYPQLRFYEADVHEWELNEQFDVIILSDTINEFWDVQGVFERIIPLCHPTTRLVMNYYNRLWELPLKIARDLNLATPLMSQNWLTPSDVKSLLYLADFEVVRQWSEVCWPVNVPLVASFFNCFLVRFWPFSHLSLANFTLARPLPPLPLHLPRVSVIVPARNEAGNIRNILERTPQMGAGTELIFVEGNSTDDTYETIQRLMPEYPQFRPVLLHQDGKGKGDAVRKGFAHATGEILMILDADLTVPPEDLPRFYDALMTGKGDFINGVRLVYPMEKDAMRFFNFLGNKFFSFIFSWLLGQPTKDTLCGTKVLWKKDYEQIAANRAYFGDFDPFGDFDLLFGAARLNYKIVDLPIRYRERTYGTTNIQRWKHGWLLLQMVGFASRRLKFI